MLAKRIIPCLDIKDLRVVKGVKFEGLRDAGDPVEVAKAYDSQGADELTFLDITASYENRKTLISLVEEIAENIIIRQPRPLPRRPLSKPAADAFKRSF